MPNGDDYTPPAQADAIDELLKQIGTPPPREFPTAQDVQDWKKNQAFYATPMEGYTRAGEGRVDIYPLASIHDWMEGGDIRGASQQPIMPNQSMALSRAWIAAQRSPTAALGFDPHHIATSPESNVSLDIAGGYRTDEDQAWFDPYYESTPVHESIHRGLRMLREADMFPDLGNHSSPAAEELIVRRYMDRLFPDYEYGRGPAGDEQIRAARRMIPFSDLDKIDEAAAMLYAQKHPRGPRASGGRTGYQDGGDRRMERLVEPFSEFTMGPKLEADPDSDWRVRKLYENLTIEPESEDIAKWRKANGGATSYDPDTLFQSQTGGTPLDDVLAGPTTAAPKGGDEVLQAVQKAGPPQRTPLDDFDPNTLFAPPIGATPSQTQTPAPQKAQAQTWYDVPGAALSNLPGSAWEFGKNVAQPFIHPVETYENLRDLGHGVLQKAGIVGGEEDKPKVDAVMEFFKNRYGSMDAVRNTIATDPVGFAADASALLTGGGSLAARAPGLVGKAGEIAQAAGRYTDPLSVATAPIRGVGNLAGKVATETTGMLTGTGAEPIKQAALAGYEGGELSKAFRANIKGEEDIRNVVTDAQNAIMQHRAKRTKDFLEGKEKALQSGDPFVILPFDKIDAALADVSQMKQFHGIGLSQPVQDIQSKLGQEVQAWKALGPHYHFADGFDALKQRVGELFPETRPGSPAQAAVTKVYGAIKSTINDYFPGYEKVMAGYSQASRDLRDLEQTFSLPMEQRRVNLDTALRKLQSTLRNNVSTSYAHRMQLADYLVQNGSPTLMAKLAGQALTERAPRGLSRLAATVGLSIAGLTGVAFPWAELALAPMFSPRFVGRTAYWGGIGTRLGTYPMRKLSPLMSRQYGYPSLQAGRLSDVTEQPAYQ